MKINQNRIQNYVLCGMWVFLVTLVTVFSQNLQTETQVREDYGKRGVIERTSDHDLCMEVYDILLEAAEMGIVTENDAKESYIRCIKSSVN